MLWVANMNLRNSFNCLVASDAEVESPCFSLCVSGLSYLKLTFALTPCWVYDIEKSLFTLVTKSKTVMYNTIFCLLAMPGLSSLSIFIF